MTEPSMSMLERMAQAIARNAEAQAQAYGAFTPYADATDRLGDAILDGHFDLYQFVDALLAEMETPSEAAIYAGTVDDGVRQDYFYIENGRRFVAAMVRAIREGA
jgi:hypothetical protein